MGLQDVIALTLALGAVVYLGRSLVGMMTGSKGCACGKVSRPADSQDAGQRNRTHLKRLPLVTIDQVGKPYPTGRTGEHHPTRRFSYTEEPAGERN